MRSSDMVRERMIRSILEGDLQINESLLPERELASQFGVGRPTIREALQRLERDGWIAARKGMPPVVNDYWTQGNLTTIVDILQCYEEIPDTFIEHMLELRITLTPAYIKEAVANHHVKVIALFSRLEELEDDAESYAMFDWELQRQLARLSANPIYLLLLNSFTDIYIPMAKKYFSVPSSRAASRQYYDELLASVLVGDSMAAGQIAKNMMKNSLQIWKRKREEE